MNKELVRLRESITRSTGSMQKALYMFSPNQPTEHWKSNGLFLKETFTPKQTNSTKNAKSSSFLQNIIHPKEANKAEQQRS